MDCELNVTCLNIEGYVEVDKYRYVYFVIMFIIYLLIICFNSTIVCLIWIHKNLHEPMYIFIAALLLNSVLFSTNIYPKLLIDVLSEKQIISYSACLFQYFIFYFLGSAEFLLLAAMSYDRYVSICKPLQYPTIMRKRNICILLVLAWVLAASHVVVQTTILSAETKLCNFTIKGIFCNNAIYGLPCVRIIVISVLGVVALVDLIILPFLFIIFTYTKILIITYRSGREVRRKAAETCLPHLMVLISFSCLSVYDIVIARVESSFPKTARLIMTLQVILYHPLFNPLIYGLKMKEISKHLKRLFCPARNI
ncbi:olfactory receptor 10AG1-like [Mastacembelus armatus]|uniref:olfactory receptor 10AG1-like n=1 Tax=Mastacembelus armatus TaxID=205130 RepID=UPI000E454D1C|nr:olfactory receptor 10AG1-like [Mastacembelus armatus]